MSKLRGAARGGDRGLAERVLRIVTRHRRCGLQQAAVNPEEGDHLPVPVGQAAPRAGEGVRGAAGARARSNSFQAG